MTSRPSVINIDSLATNIKRLEDQLVDLDAGGIPEPPAGYRDWLLKGIEIQSVELANEGRRFAQKVDDTGWAWKHRLDNGGGKYEAV